jgi:hypothetical protein
MREPRVQRNHVACASSSSSETSETSASGAGRPVSQAMHAHAESAPMPRDAPSDRAVADDPQRERRRARRRPSGRGSHFPSRMPASGRDDVTHQRKQQRERVLGDGAAFSLPVVVTTTPCSVAAARSTASTTHAVPRDDAQLGAASITRA